MNNHIALFEQGSPEYNRLVAAANRMNTLSPRGLHYYVGDTYFDYGQGWMWTTILRVDDMFGSVQVLCPAEQRNIVNAAKISDIEAAVERYFAGKWCTDRAS